MVAVLLNASRRPPARCLEGAWIRRIGFRKRLSSTLSGRLPLLFKDIVEAAVKSAGDPQLDEGLTCTLGDRQPQVKNVGQEDHPEPPERRIRCYANTESFSAVFRQGRDDVNGVRKRRTDPFPQVSKKRGFLVFETLDDLCGWGVGVEKKHANLPPFFLEVACKHAAEFGVTKKRFEWQFFLVSL